MVIATGVAADGGPSVDHRHADRQDLEQEVGVLVQAARYPVALDPRYLGGEELGYRRRGRHRRYPGPIPAATDRRTRPEEVEVAGIRIQPCRSSSTCPADKAGVVVVGPGRPLVWRVHTAVKLPTRRQTRRCVVAKASSDIFSRLPSAWKAYDSGIVRGARISADGGGHGHGGVQHRHADQASPICCYLWNR